MLLSPLGFLIENPESSNIKDQTLEYEPFPSTQEIEIKHPWQSTKPTLGKTRWSCYFKCLPLQNLISFKGRKHNLDSLKCITQDVKQKIDYKVYKESGKCDPCAIVNVSNMSPSHCSLFTFCIYNAHLKNIDKWPQKVTHIKICIMKKLRSNISKSQFLHV